MLNVTVWPLEHFLVASPDVLCLRHVFCRPGSRKWRSTPRGVVFFSFSFFFFGRTKNLGICEAMKDSSWRSLRVGTAFARRSDVIGLPVLLRRMQTLNWDAANVDTKSKIHSHPPQGETDILTPDIQLSHKNITLLKSETLDVESERRHLGLLRLC